MLYALVAKRRAGCSGRAAPTRAAAVPVSLARLALWEKRGVYAPRAAKESPFGEVLDGLCERCVAPAAKRH